MDNPTVSVIIPIYNVEPYLRRCVDSVLVQTLSELEIILVDDGSPDGCPSICDEYAGRDSRIKVLHKINGGLSSARNAGLDAATGDFIAFVDSDDYIAPEMVKKLLNALQEEEEEADISICGIQRVNEFYAPIGKTDTYCFQLLTGMQALDKLFTNDYVYFTVACNKLFKRFLFSSYRFPVGKLFEDGYAAFRYYFASKTVVCLPNCFYFYLTRSNSITTSSISLKNLDGLDAEVDSINFLKEKGVFELLAKAQIKYVGAIIFNLKRYNLKKSDVQIKFREIHRDFSRLFTGIIKNPLLSKKEKLLLTIFRISPKLCKWIIKVKNL
ncbi:MAG: glycosyltransferase family 2 protein [Eubacteriales bacterium]